MLGLALWSRRAKVGGKVLQAGTRCTYSRAGTPAQYRSSRGKAPLLRQAAQMDGRRRACKELQNLFEARSGVAVLESSEGGLVPPTGDDGNRARFVIGSTDLRSETAILPTYGHRHLF